ncbi:MAG TPA: hypothetical protein VLB47_10735 [Solirubrobacteraceae bacterium]|nr:hypothetical protein [Solirubrobacteraceae bacterium]
MLSIVKAAGGTVSRQVVLVNDDAATAPASIFHTIAAPAGASGLGTRPSSSGTAAAAGPFLTGALQFAGEPPGALAMGKLSGEFTARFDSIGAQALAAATPTRC